MTTPAAPRNVTVLQQLHGRVVDTQAALRTATASWRREWFVRPSDMTAVGAVQDPATGEWVSIHSGYRCLCGNDHSLEAGETLASWRAATKYGTEARYQLPGAPPFVPVGLTIVDASAAPHANVGKAEVLIAANHYGVRPAPVAFYSREGRGKDLDGCALNEPRGIWLAADLAADRMKHVARHEVAHLKMWQLGQPHDEAAIDALAATAGELALRWGRPS